MTCTRCQGLMVGEAIIDMEATGNQEMWGRTWRCVNCGHRDDAVIQQHRRVGIERPVRRLTVVAVQEESVVAYEPDPVEPLAA